MKYYLVAVRDSKVEAFMTPVATVSLPQAQRSFLKEVGEGGEFYNMRRDVSLHLLCEVDEESGVVDASVARRLVDPALD